MALLSRILNCLPFAALAATCLFFDYSTRWNNQVGAFAAGVLPPGASRWTALAGCAVFGLLLWVLGKRRSPRFVSRFTTGCLLFALLAAQLLCLILALPSLRAMPWGIDHPCFLFRIAEFLDVFPALGSYNPWWNGGVEHFIGVTSGAHAFAFLLLPFLPFGSLESVYAPALFFWIFVGAPWLAALSMRLIGCRWRTALVAALLMLPFTRAEFLFFWQSGNVGGLATCVMTPPLVALSYRLALLKRGGYLLATLLAVAVWLSCIWPAGCVTAMGLAFAALLNWRRTLSPRKPLLFAVALSVLLLSPWLWALLFPSRAIVAYAADAPARDAPLLSWAWSCLAIGVRFFFRRVAEWHHLLFPFGVVGLLTLRPRRAALFFGGILAVLAAFAVSIGFARNSQIDRVALQMAAAAVVPASLAVSRFLSPRRAAPAWARGLVLACLLLAPAVAARHAANAAGFKLWPVQPAITGFADWIRANVPPDGRLAFADLTDCRYDWGKIAHLPLLADREMMSDDYYGFPKGLTARRFPPKAYRASEETYLAFTRLYGITHWSVADDRNRRFFDSSPHFAHAARFLMQGKPIDVYRFLDAPAPTRFLLGEGRVEARPNSIAVFPADPAADRLVLRYNWRPGLRCAPPAQLEPFPADENLTFVAVRPNGLPRVDITYRPGWHRLLPNYDGTFHH